MSPVPYSFLDVAVLDDVRSRFAAGDALVILSGDLDEVIWANGPGAAVFGYADIEDIIGAASRLGTATKRQIASSAGFPQIGRDRPIVARMATGLSSRTVTFLASTVALPDGESAIMLAVPAAVGGGRDAAEIAAHAIGGFEQPGHVVAFLDGRGGVEAASPGFAALGLAPDALAELVDRLAAGGGRMVKRMLAGSNGPLPAGLVKLTDDPARHFLVVIDESRIAAGEPAQSGTDDVKAAGKAEPAADDGAAAAAEIPDRSDPRMPANDVGDDVAGVEEPAVDGEAPDGNVGRQDNDNWYFDARGEAGRLASAAETAQGEVGQPQTADAAVAAAGTAADEVPPEMEPEATEAEAGADDLAQESDAATAADVQPEPMPDAAPAAGTIEASPARVRSSAPIRFVWRTDAGGRFSQVSVEFLDAVGFADADLIGQPFAEVAERLGLDPSGEIAGLLARRDTWSGRSVLWPVVGAGLRIPVDLAALPVYSRMRAFEGFRGFGVARLGDAVADTVAQPEAEAPAVTSGISVRPVEPDQASGPVEDADPFRGEVPALEIAPAEEPRSDKVIRLAEHRPATNGRSLSTGERIAFQQIAERLRKETVKPDASPAPPPAEMPGDASASEGDATQAGNEAVTSEAAPLDAASDETGEAATPETGDDVGADDLESDLSLEDEAVSELLILDGAIDSDVAAADEAPAEEPTPTQDATEAAQQDEPVAEAAGPATAAPRKPGRAGMSLFHFGMDDDAPEQTEIVDDGVADTDTADVPETASAAADQATAPAAEAAEAASTAPETPAADGQEPSATPPVQAPALKTEGITPSAFPETTPRRGRPDTSILEKLPVPVLVHSGDTLHYANDEFFALTGFASVAELAEAGGIGSLFADPYEDRESPERTDRQLRLRRRDGEEMPVEAFLQSVPWSGGKALLLVLSRPRQGLTGPGGQSPVIAELEARVAEMRTILDTATDGVVLISPDGNIRSISRPAEALFGLESDEVAGRPFQSLFAIESQRAARDYLNGLSDNGVASVLNDGREVIGREAEGRFIPLFMTIGKMPNDSGFCAVMRDITPWKRAEEELTQARAVAERASSHKTEFLARVSHEIRTPLNAIIGFSELMVDEKFGPVANDRYRDYLRDINRSGNHVLDLVNDLLDISKIEAGQQDMAYEAVPLNDTLAETVAMMQPQANRERVIIRSSFASKLPDVVADLRSVRQIALNVLSNAVRYTQAGGQVIVSTSYENGDVVMRVRDTGIGMTQAEIEQALKPFKQINSLKRARGDGTGLGLPLTKAMVEANRARFLINSTPGEGTLVEVTFPSTRVLAD